MHTALGPLQAVLLLFRAALRLLGTSGGLLGAALGIRQDAIRQGRFRDSCHLSLRNPKVVDLNPLYYSCLLLLLLLLTVCTLAR